MWKSKDAINYRHCTSVARKLDSLVKKYGTITIDHGIANYEYDHYEFNDRWNKSMTIYVKDFNHNGKVIEYMTFTDDMLRKPIKDDFYVELVSCYWEKEFPKIFVVYDYCVK